MSRTIDEKVVKMQFNNKQFESGVKTTMSSLDKLKKSLEFDEAAKGFNNISKYAKNVDLSPLSEAVETVKIKFSAFEIMAARALMNITDSAINTGKQLVKSLSIDQISAGWGKYAEKTASVQTIMNATGKSIDEVNGYLDKLMWFSDETSYGFTDMTSALGQLTSAGGDIDKLIPMITGIANATAFAGKGATEFKRAIYNLNQSYSAGYLQYMDWRSLELAGVASKDLKQIFIDIGEELGKINEGEVTIANFSQTLKDKWADTEVMEKAFGKFGEMSELAYKMVQSGEVDTASEAYEILAEQYSGVGITAAKAAQEAKTFTEAIEATKDAVSSGWMKTFELIFGNYQEAKVLWTDLANSLWNVFASGGESRNELLEGALTSGWTQWISQGIKNSDAYIETLKEVAKEQGVAIDSMLEDGKSFEDSLKEGWVTADMLSESVTRLTGKMSGLSDEQLTEAGYSKTQLEALENLNKGIEDGSIDVEEYANKINRLSSGRENLINSFWNVWNAIFQEDDEYVGVLGKIKEAFSEIFPATTVDRIYAFTQRLSELTEKFKISDTTAENLKNTFKGFFAILDSVKTTINSIFKILSPLWGGFQFLSSEILSATGSLGKWLVGANETYKSSEQLANIVETLTDFVTSLVTAVKRLFYWASTRLGGMKTLTSLLDGVENGFSSIVDIVEKMFSFADGKIDVVSGITKFLDAIIDKVEKFLSYFTNGGIGEIFLSLLNGIERVASSILSVVSKFVGDIIDKLAELDFTSLFNLVGVFSAFTLTKTLSDLNERNKKGGLLGLLGLDSTINTVKNKFKNGGIQEAATKFGSAIDTLTEKLKNPQDNLKPQVLIQIASAIGIMAWSLVTISEIDSDKLLASVTAMVAMLVELFTALESIGKIEKISKSSVKAILSMIPMASAVFILALALKQLSGLSTGDVIKGTAAIYIMANTLVGVSKKLSEASNKLSEIKIKTKGEKIHKYAGKIQNFAGQMLVMSAAVLVLAEAVKQISGLSTTQVITGVAAIYIMISTLVEASNKLSEIKVKAEDGKIKKFAGQMLVMSAAVLVLSEVVKRLSVLSTDNVIKGVAAIFVMISTLVAASKQLGKIKVKSEDGKIQKFAGQMLVMSAAVLVLSEVAKRMSKMNWTELEKAGISLVAIVGLLVGVTKIMGKADEDNMTNFVGQLLFLSVAIGAVALIGKVISQMSWTEIEKAAIGLLGVVTLLVAVAQSMTANGDLTAFSGQMLVMSAAVAILGGTLKLLGTLSLGAMAISLGGLATAFIILGVAAKLLGKAIPVLVQLAGSMALIGLGVAAIGGGVLALGTGLTSLFSSFSVLSVSATAIVTSIKAIVLGILDMIPEMVDSLTNTVIALCNVIIKSAPAIAEAIEAVLFELLDNLIGDIPEVVDTLFEFLIQIIDTLAERLPELVTSVAKLFTNFFTAIIDALKNVDPDVLVDGLKAVGIIASIVATFAGLLLLTPLAMLGVAGAGLVVAELAVMLAALGALAQIPGLTWIVNEGVSLLGSIGSAIGAFVGGFVGEALSGITDDLPRIATDLSQFMENLEPFIDGASRLTESSMAGVKSLAEVILMLTGADILDSLTSWFSGGRSSLADFGKELAEFGPYFKEYANSIDGIDTEAVTASASAAQALSELAKNLPNEGGLVGWFAGENSIATFGAGLVEFGEDLSSYAEKVSGLDADVVINSTNAAKAVSELAKELPNSGGLVSWLTGNNDIGAFGTGLEQFGTGFKSYSEKMSGIDADVLTKTTTAINTLIELRDKLPEAEGLFSTKMSFSDFGNEISRIGTGLNSINAESLSSITTDIGTLIGCFSSFTAENNESAKSFGIALADIAINGLSELTNCKDDFEKTGADLISILVNSMIQKATQLYAQFHLLATNICNGLRANYSEFESAGKYLVTGFANGITNNVALAEEAARQMGNSTATALRNSLAVESPSRVAFSIGSFFGQGFVNAIDEYTDKAYYASKNMAESARNGLNSTISRISDAVTNGIDSQPQIRPILDLSDVESKASQLNAMFSRNQAMSISSKMNADSSYDTNQNAQAAATGSTYTFTQNNYSPKALSRLEIYRQTKNQFSAMKGLVKA